MQSSSPCARPRGIKSWVCRREPTITPAFRFGAQRARTLLQMSFLLRLWRLGFRVRQSPRESERERIAQAGVIGFVLPVVLEKHAEILGRHDVVDLQAGCVNGIERRVFIQAGVGRDLPLVVSHSANLQQLREVLLQRQDLADAPFVAERLPRRNVGAVFVAVDLPVRKQVGAGSLVLGEVDGGTGREMVAKIAVSDVIAGSRREAAGRSAKWRQQR